MKGAGMGGIGWEEGREVDLDGGGVGGDVEPLEEEGVAGATLARVHVQVWLSPFH